MYDVVRGNVEAGQMVENLSGTPREHLGVIDKGPRDNDQTIQMFTGNSVEQE